MDEPRRDAPDPQEERSRSGAEPPDPSGVDVDVDLRVDQDPLLQLLRLLTEQQGSTKTANRLGVDRKTVWRALDAGRLTPRLRDALEREQVATEWEAAGGDHLQLRVEGLERRLQEVEEQLAGGLAGLAGLAGLREDLSNLRQEVRASARSLPDGTGSETASTAHRSPHRNHPEVVTVDVLRDDAEVFGAAMPLITEWRQQQARFDQHWPSLEGLEAEVQMLELEIELIEERRLTLPPGQLPWEWDQCRQEAARRAQRLGAARSALKRARRRRWLLRLTSLGLLGR